MINTALNVIENVQKDNKTGNESIDSLFGDNYNNNTAKFLDAWDFRRETIDTAIEEGNIHHVDIDTPNTICKLVCDYCFVKDDPRYQSSNLISFDEWVDMVNQLNLLGLESVKIVGQGETTDDPLFFNYLEHLDSLGIKSTLFSSGYIFGGDNLSQKVHGMTGIEVIDKTFDLGASIMIKLDSPRSLVQDKLVGVRGFSETRDKAISRILQTDYLHKDGSTTFGFETNLGSHNAADIFSIYALRKLAGIYTNVCLTMDCNAVEKLKKGNTVSGLTYQEIEDIYVGVHLMNRVLGIEDEGVSPFVGGIKCAQVSLPSLYVSSNGDIYFACCGNTEDKIGNLKLMSINEAYDQAKVMKDSYGLQNLHGCPFREKKGIMAKGLAERVEARVEKMVG